METTTIMDYIGFRSLGLPANVKQEHTHPDVSQVKTIWDFKKIVGGMGPFSAVNVILGLPVQGKYHIVHVLDPAALRRVNIFYQYPQIARLQTCRNSRSKNVDFNQQTLNP